VSASILTQLACKERNVTGARESWPKQIFTQDEGAWDGLGQATPAPGPEVGDLGSIRPRQHGGLWPSTSAQKSLAGNKTPTLPCSSLVLPLSQNTVSDPREAKVGQGDNFDDTQAFGRRQVA
jgi:hypothetical protein